VSEALQWNGAIVVLIAFGFSQAGRCAASLMAEKEHFGSSRHKRWFGT
jgi:hypothetical protein